MRLSRCGVRSWRERHWRNAGGLGTPGRRLARRRERGRACQGLAPASRGGHRRRPDEAGIRRGPQDSRGGPEAGPGSGREEAAGRLMILLDTDHFSVFTDERDPRHERLRTRMEAAAELVACTIVSVGPGTAL